MHEQGMRIGDTFKANAFICKSPLAGSAPVTLLIPEERQYPQFMGNRPATAHIHSCEPEPAETSTVAEERQPVRASKSDATPVSAFSARRMKPLLQERHLVVHENAKDWE